MRISTLIAVFLGATGTLVTAESHVLLVIVYWLLAVPAIWQLLVHTDKLRVELFGY